MSKEYLPRIVDKTLERMLKCVGAVLIAGPKWCGKTTTAEQHAKSVLKMQDPDKTRAYIATAETKPSLLLVGDKPRLIDEWQMAPVIWDAVRMSVDEIGEDGLYILTGSTSVGRDKIMHTGTGRIAKLVMLPMSLYESKESVGNISLTELFNNKELDIDGKMSNLSIENLICLPRRVAKQFEKRGQTSGANDCENVPREYLRFRRDDCGRNQARR